MSHIPIPGPDYWDWRCLVCGQAVADHPSLWRRIFARLKPTASNHGGANA